jgi:hypothetical protein
VAKKRCLAAESVGPCYGVRLGKNVTEDMKLKALV